MARLGAGVALALLAVVVEQGPQAHAVGGSLTGSDRVPSSQLLAQTQAGRRSALVIGNGAYTEERLANAVNDAEAVARTLQEIGFSVTLVRNADKRAIDEAVEAFSRRLGPGEIGLFYFSGHGVQVDGENYLVPINAQLSRQADAQYDAVPLGKVINAVETTRASAKIIILDACRNNPFYRRWRSTARGGPTRGLATPLSSGDGGTLIAFSTAPGKEASDGIGSSPNSPFTTYLLRHLRTPNLEVGLLFRRVRSDVIQATAKQQIPWESGALIGEVFLNQRAPGVAGALDDGPVQPVSSSKRSYRFQTQFTGNTKCLDIVMDGINDRLTMADCANYFGQLWSIEYTKGSYRLRTQLTGSNKCLDIVNDGNNNKLTMANCGNYTGQFWIIKPFADGFHRLQTQFTGNNKCLDIVNDGKNNLLVMADCRNYSGQFWKIF
jgi:hypothetical protein